MTVVVCGNTECDLNGKGGVCTMDDVEMINLDEDSSMLYCQSYSVEEDDDEE